VECLLHSLSPFFLPAVAIFILDGLVSQVISSGPTMVKKLSRETRKYLASLGRKGGRARTDQMTAAERKELARKAVKARWAKQKKAK
jgi:hypothetical protein